jgi:hypothetical protein
VSNVGEKEDVIEVVPVEDPVPSREPVAVPEREPEREPVDVPA